MEEWKDIPRYKELYQASSLGRIRNKKNKKILKGCKDKDGYLITNLSKNGKKRTEKIHRLIGETFLPNINNYSSINHKNEIKTDNNVENLEWCTVAYNNAYSKSIKIAQYTSKMNLIKIWNNSVEAAKELNLFATNIRKCCRTGKSKCGGYIWKYV